MKRNRWLVLLLMLGAIGCTSWQKGVTDPALKGQDIVYLRDDRTDLCFAVLMLGNKVNTKVSDMAMTQVPCSSLGNVTPR
jgi:hypothetical protein